VFGYFILIIAIICDRLINQRPLDVSGLIRMLGDGLPITVILILVGEMIVVPCSIILRIVKLDNVLLFFIMFEFLFLIVPFLAVFVYGQNFSEYEKNCMVIQHGVVSQCGISIVASSFASIVVFAALCSVAYWASYSRITGEKNGRQV